MIVKINFKNHESMLFGDSYKPWEMQAGEFLLSNKELIPEITTLEKSTSKWVGWGRFKVVSCKFNSKTIKQRGLSIK